MTPQEAINIIDDVTWDDNGRHYGKVSSAREISKQALEKQIPQQPYYWGDGYDENGALIYDNAECPNCGNNDFEYDINNWGCKFCPDCGQALDWSDNE